jgi:hypothetical protein
MHQIGTLLPVGLGFIVWLAVVAYLLYLATRLVRAVEEIARKTGG